MSRLSTSTETSRCCGFILALVPHSQGCITSFQAEAWQALSQMFSGGSRKRIAKTETGLE